MEEQEKTLKQKKGCWPIILKAVAVVTIVYLIEALGHWLYGCFNKEELSQVLTPFHNYYFAFNKYYLTSHNFSFEFTGDISSTFRMIILTFINLILSTFISVIIAAIPGVKKYSGKIYITLFLSIFVLSFLATFFFPSRKSVIDATSKEIAITNYNYIFFPSTDHISFGDIKNIDYTYAYDYDLHNHTYNIYLVIMAEKTNAEKKRLGETYVGQLSSKRDTKPDFKASPETVALGEKTILLLKQAIGK
jgi:hypothetical protein